MNHKVYLESLPDQKPPVSNIGVLGWLKTHLFSSWGNALLTVASIYFLYLIIPGLLRWSVIDATWLGNSSASCKVNSGACWVFIKTHLLYFTFGAYPSSSRWRVIVAFLVLVPLTIVAIKLSSRYFKIIALVFGFFILPVIIWYLLIGGVFGLNYVPIEKWGGMMVTLLIAASGILFSLPFGIMLALGRVSDLPVISVTCTVIIEFWRGVPLITILFMSSVMLPLFLPKGFHANNLLRAIIGVTFFASAYMAEVVRGGLQSIDKGQYESADSLGLTYFQKIALVILPQALRTMIPAITNTYVGLLKETTLVSIIGLFDFLNIVNSASRSAAWGGYNTEGYVFAALVYFILCYSISRGSYRLEAKLSLEKQ